MEIINPPSISLGITAAEPGGNPGKSTRDFVPGHTAGRRGPGRARTEDFSNFHLYFVCFKNIQKPPSKYPFYIIL
jgi:hypothetical protein